MASTPTNLTIPIDPELKAQAKALFDELGLSLSGACNIFLRQAVREGRIPFEITLNSPAGKKCCAERIQKVMLLPCAKKKAPRRGAFFLVLLLL